MVPLSFKTLGSKGKNFTFDKYHFCMMDYEKQLEKSPRQHIIFFYLGTIRVHISSWSEIVKVKMN